MPQPLPIDGVLDEVARTLGRTRALVLEAPPGTGKTTRVPPALLRAGVAGDGEIWVLEPRRIAARMAARRVAEELGEEVGRTIGYRMRFEQAGGPETRIRFVTEGILGRRLLDDAELRGVGAVVLDEVHERHLSGDIGLAMLRRLQRGARPDLALCAMSATLDATTLASFLEAPVIRAEGRMHPVEIEHLPRTPDGPLEDSVRSALAQLLPETPGDALVFLAGALEIRRCMDACSALAQRHDCALLPLHGSLPPAEQDRAVRRGDRRKIVLSTNVAESSLTIDGVTLVVDSGLHRLAAHAPWSGLPTLRVAPISRASATQRAGRAGRTQPGRCLRLYTRGDLQARREHDVPEVARADLGETVLELCAAGVADAAAFPWFEAPPPASLEAARVLLARLGAVRDGALTDTGRAMLRFPLHPRLSRALVEAERRGVARGGAALVAIIGERGIASGGARPGGGRSLRRDAPSADALDALQSYREAEAARFEPHRLHSFGVDVGRARAAQRVAGQLERILHARRGRGGGPAFEDAPAPGDPAEEQALRMALLSGFPDRVGRLRRPTSSTGRTGLEVVFAGGGTAVLDDDAGGWGSDLVAAIDAEERTEGRHTRARVRLASSVHVDWLLELFFDEVRDETVVAWNAAAERVEARRVLAWGDLVLEESGAGAGAGDEAAVAAKLAEQALARGIGRFVDEEAFDRWRARVGFVRRHAPEVGMPEIDPAYLRDALAELCVGCASFADLRNADLAGALQRRLAGPQTRALAEMAPESITLPGGRRTRVDYAQDPPALSSRLQDFFGMGEGPRVAGGRVPLVLHLLAPNQRAVQVTTDLAGFWQRHYPALARELRRRYPRHSWPEDPLHSSPSPPLKPRRS